MEIQIDHIISILSTLLTGGVLIILIETLHLSNAIDDKFYNKMEPFERHFVSYVDFVKSIQNRISYANDIEGYSVKLKKLIHEIALINVEHSIYTSFSAKELDNLCINTINGIWYFLSEKSQYVRPYVYFEEEGVYDIEIIQKHLNELSPNYKDLKPSLDTLMIVSGDFYVDKYKPIDSIFFQFEFLKKRMYKMNVVNFVYVFLITIFLLITIFFNVVLCSWIYFIMTVIFTSSFLYILYNFIIVYNESVSKLK